MRFALSDDQELFVATIRDLLAVECSRTALRTAWESDGRVPTLMSRLAGLGVTALAIPESAGGLGGDVTDLVPVLVEMGRAGLPEPLLGGLVAGRLLAADAAPVAAQWVPQLVEGSAVVGLGVGSGELVADATVADLLLMADASAVYAVPAEEAIITAQDGADRAARIGGVIWTARPEQRLAVSAAEVLTGAALLSAAQLLGLGLGLLEMSVSYAGQREQFGRAIGSFQAVKHQLADTYISLAFARPLLDRAAWSVAGGLETRDRDVSMAKHAAAEAAERAARVALQVHGGIGYTYEHDLHMWAKQVWSLSSRFGDARWHRARVADAVLDRSEPRVP